MGIVVIVSPRRFDIAGLLIRNGGNTAILESYGFRKYSILLNFAIRRRVKKRIFYGQADRKRSPPPPHIGPTLAPEAILFESPCRAHSGT